MSSLIFQPLLHDSLGWKSSNSTYADHYKWKRYRTTSKDKKLSSYGQQYQRQQQQQQQQQLYGSLPSADRDETIKRVIVVKKDEENRSAKQKTSHTIIDEPPVLIVEYKRRSASTNNLNASSESRAASQQRSVTAVEEKRRPATSIDIQRHEKVEKRPVDANNDNSRHWLTYPNPRTPQYLVDIKQRLGQLKVPSTLARPASASSPSASNVVVQQQQEEEQRHLSERPSSASKQQQAAERHFMSYAPTETPPDLRAARYRIRKERYNPSLDNYPLRPQTSPGRPEDANKFSTTPAGQDYNDEHLPPPPSKDEAWGVDDESKTPEDESSSVLVQLVDVEGLPSEYVDALETAAEAQDAYRRNATSIGERRPDNPVYRFSATTPDISGNSLVAFRNQQHSAAATTSMNNNPLRHVARTSHNDFGAWVRNATDKERASAMKILQDVLHQPMLGYDSPTKHQAIFKQPPAPPPIRASSATRKLGRTRTQHQFPCEICEKLLIKRHVWDLSRIECPHSIVIA